MNLLVEVVSILRREKIDHALIGATAMAVHGVSRATADVDLLTVDARVLESALWESLSTQGVSLRPTHPGAAASTPAARLVRRDR